MQSRLFLTVAFALAPANLLFADTFGSGANTFEIEFVTIGSPGNPADTTGSPNPTGAVPYEFRIEIYETSEDMVDKANTLGNLAFNYFYVHRGPDKPATGLTWNMAARFVNWLNTSSGYPPAYKFDYQPGEPRYNANDLVRYWSLSDPGYQADNRIRNKMAKYFLPDVDEWYKAAYYDPVAGHYWDYPTGSDTPPDGIDFVGDTQFDAVFWEGGTLHDPFDVTNVGVLSPYGTAGQGGNVTEWQETPESPTAPFPAPDRIIRGGNYVSPVTSLSSSATSLWGANSGASIIGFRVASVAIPEPSAFVLLLWCTAAVVVARGRTRRDWCRT